MSHNKKTKQYSTDGGYMNSEYKYKFSVKDINKWDTEAWVDRGISIETMKFYGVKVGYDEHDGKFGGIRYIAFPYYSGDGSKVIGYKVLDSFKTKEESGYFEAVGTVSVKCQLFGEKVASEKGTAKKKLYISEGEADCLALFETMRKQLKTKEDFKHFIPCVVSIHIGTPNAVKSITEREEFIREYSEIILCFDNDARKENESKSVIRGREATEAVGAYLFDKDVFVVQIPDGYKDPCDFTKKGDYTYLSSILFPKKLKKFRPEKIVDIREALPFEDFMKPIEKGVNIPSFPKLMSKILGIRPYELTVGTALSGVGKSSIFFEIVYCMAEQGHNVGLMMLEERLRKTVNRMVARRLKVHPNLFKFDQHCGGHSLKEVREAYEWAADLFHCVDHYGSLKSSYLLSLIKNLHFNKNCFPILFDHITLAMSDAGIVNKTAALDDAMDKLGSFCENNPIHLFVVSHLNRDASKDKKKDVQKPTWFRTGMENLRGSGSLESVAWNVMCISNEILPDKTRGRVQIDLPKNREADKLGLCDITKMDEKTGLFYDASDDIWCG